MQDPVDAMLQYMEEFIERPHPAFGGLPICPFAKGARQSGRILFVVTELGPGFTGHVEEAEALLDQNFYELVIFVDPRKDAPRRELCILFAQMRLDLKGMGVSVFDGHPEDDTRIAGVRTRRDPYPNIQLVRDRDLRLAEAALRKSPYYDKWG